MGLSEFDYTKVKQEDYTDNDEVNMTSLWGEVKFKIDNEEKYKDWFE